MKFNKLTPKTRTAIMKKKMEMKDDKKKYMELLRKMFDQHDVT
jgi:hypothetical protein